MCGICGIVGFADKNLLERMNGVMAHRGPDDAGLYLGEKMGLAHRRLSIIDLEGGHQPIHNEDGRLWIVFNGEIYNYRQLRDDLLQKGHVFSTRSDTEVILHLYEEYGKGCLSRLRGMFAFAIWDGGEGRLFLARDRLGIKPLYYVQQDGKLLFASEIKCLLEWPALRPRVDRRALDLFLSFRFTPGPHTMFAGVYKLAPGHFLEYKDNKTVIEKYWDIDFTPDDSLSARDLSLRLREKLSEAIEMRLISEVPLGAYLSGGLDSSFIVGLMSGLSQKAVETFSVGFREEKFNELQYAQLIADHFHTNHHTLYAERGDDRLLEKITWHLDEPLADAAVIPTYLMAELTKRYVTVVLSGEGADELLAGYPKYKALSWLYKANSIFPLPGGDKLASRLAHNINLNRLLSAWGNRDRARAYMELAAVFSTKEKESLYSPLLRGETAGHDRAEKLVRPYFAAGEEPLSQLLLLDIKTWLPDDLLLKNDKMSMAHAVEARVPYLDHELVEMMAAVPARYKLRFSTEKYILRRAMEGVIPREIARRKKTGFTVPLGSWFGGGLREKTRGVLNRETVEAQGYFNWDYVHRVMERDLNNQYYRRQFWALFTFTQWHKVFIG